MQIDGTAAAVLQTIRTRRSVRKFTTAAVSRQTLSTLLEAATWAPNHRHTEPWRFFVLEKDGPARRRIADLVADWTFHNVKNPTPERRQQSADAVREEVLDAPAFLYAFALPGRDEEVTRENYAATACAMHNMQLAAHAMGLAAGWSTGKVCLPEQLRAELGAGEDWQMVGALFIGYPDALPEAKRTPYSELTRWL
jgi:nitroreductase